MMESDRLPKSRCFQLYDSKLNKLKLATRYFCLEKHKSQYNHDDQSHSNANFCLSSTVTSVAIRLQFKT